MVFTEENMNNIYRQFVAQQASCITCGAQFDQIGAFFPKDQSEVEAPPDKLRGFFYPICDQCQADAEVIAKIEALAIKNFQTEH